MLWSGVPPPPIPRSGGPGSLAAWLYTQCLCVCHMGGGGPEDTGGGWACPGAFRPTAPPRPHTTTTDAVALHRACAGRVTRRPTALRLSKGGGIPCTSTDASVASGCAPSGDGAGLCRWYNTNTRLHEGTSHVMTVRCQDRLSAWFRGAPVLFINGPPAFPGSPEYTQ